MEKVNGKKMAITRILVALIFVLNMVLSNVGWTPLDLDEETIYQLVSAVALLASVVWAWWKNNNVTKEAEDAQKVLDKVKKEKEGEGINGGDK